MKFRLLLVLLPIFAGWAALQAQAGTIDPTFVQEAYLKASNTDVQDFFGDSVAIDGDTVVIGTSNEDSNATGVNGNQADNSAEDAGAAYVYVRDGSGNWSQQAYLKASNTEAGDSFGESVAIDGNTIVVGADREDSAATGVNGPDNNLAPGSGAAYVFVRDGSGNWSQQAYLKASNTDAEDDFGEWVAIDGDTIVVGANDESSSATGVNGDQADNSAEDAGAAYVFVRDGAGNWSQQAYLKPSNTDAGDDFGNSVAIDGNTIVVGADREFSIATGINGDQADNSAFEAGAAYVFVRDGSGNWSQQAYLKASNTDEVDSFGESVAIDGDTIVIGAILESSNATGVNGDQINNAAEFAGAAYVFVRDGAGVWSQQAYLKASNADAGDLLGDWVAIDGNTVVVDAVGESSNATGVNGNQADNSAEDAGAAYVFVRDGAGNWSQQAYLKASNTEAGDRFGNSLAFEGETIVVAATSEDSSATGVNGNQTDNSAQNAGAAYVFNLVFSVGGAVSGLSGSGLVLQINGGDDLPITADGVFTFPTSLDGGSAYVVTVADQPTDLSQTCVVSNGSGTISGASVTDVQITCVTDTFSIGGTVSGLSGSGLVLQNNGGDDLAITGNGPFSFATALDDGSAYAVTVLTQPTGLNQTCTVTNGSGTLSGADVTDVQITCVTDTFTVGGNVSGLNGTGLVLQNNGGDDLPITADGPFAFATPLDDGSDYAVMVLNQPVTARDQQCTVVNGSGTLMGADINDVAVQCEDILIDLSASDLDLGLVLIGAQGSATITLTNAGQPDLVISDISRPSAPFAIAGGDCLSLPLTLSAGQSCQIDIIISPTAAGTFSDSLQITSNATSSPDTVRLSGTASFEPLIVPTLNLIALLVLLGLLGLFGLIQLRNPSRGVGR